MTPDELRAARRRLGLSSYEKFGRFGSAVGEPIATQESKAPRYWQAGRLPIPGSVALLLQIALRWPEVRRWLETGQTGPGEGERHQAPEFSAIAPERPPVDPVPAFTLWPYGCRDSASCAHHRECMYVPCVHRGKDITARIDALTSEGG